MIRMLQLFLDIRAIMTFAIMKDGIGSVLYTGEKQKKINTDDGTKASASEVRYMNQVEEGWRADGCYQID